MQQNQTNRHQFAYKRQPSNQIFSSTFNPNLPSGHTTTIRQYEGNPYSPATAIYGSTAVAEREPAAPAPATSSSPLGNFNLASLTKYADPDELKGLMDRFGGLDGILATVTKVQKVMSTVGQIAPMAKVFTGIMGNKKPSNTNESTETEDNQYVSARRKSAKRSSVKDKARRVQVKKSSKRTDKRRSQVYTPSTKKQ